MSTQAQAAGSAHPDREIQEDVMNVPLIAWLGVVSSVLIIVSVLLLIGVYYMTKSNQMAERQADADQRMSDLEAARAIDNMVVNGFYKLPDTVIKVEGAEDETIRGGYTMPIERGMRQIVETPK